jgi:hypothetical protein
MSRDRSLLVEDFVGLRKAPSVLDLVVATVRHREASIPLADGGELG